MREIKFRAWDKVKKEMLIKFDDYDADLCISMNGVVLTKTDNGACGDPECCGEYREYMTDDNNNKFIVMQYTGLKDKNGKEIYEGDIIQTNNIEGKTLFIITFEDNYCGSFGSFVARHIKSFKNNGSISSIHCEATECGKIVGNIYENPELLEETNDDKKGER